MADICHILLKFDRNGTPRRLSSLQIDFNDMCAYARLSISKKWQYWNHVLIVVIFRIHQPCEPKVHNSFIIIHCCSSFLIRVGIRPKHHACTHRVRKLWRWRQRAHKITVQRRGDLTVGKFTKFCRHRVTASAILLISAWT